MSEIEIVGDGPIGVWSVLYYAWGKRLREGDSNLSLQGARTSLARIHAWEVGVATCQSQPGKMTGYGSPEARAVYEQALEAEARDRVQAREDEITQLLDGLGWIHLGQTRVCLARDGEIWAEDPTAVWGLQVHHLGPEAVRVARRVRALRALIEEGER